MNLPTFVIQNLRMTMTHACLKMNVSVWCVFPQRQLHAGEICRSDQHCPQDCPFDPAYLLLSATAIRTLGGPLITRHYTGAKITLEQKSHSRQGHACDGSLTMFHRERSFRDDQLSCFLWEILFPSNLKMLMINIAKRQWGQHLSKATQEHLQTEESSFLYNR